MKIEGLTRCGFYATDEADCTRDSLNPDSEFIFLTTVFLTLMPFAKLVGRQEDWCQENDFETRTVVAWGVRASTDVWAASYGAISVVIVAGDFNV